MAFRSSSQNGSASGTPSVSVPTGVATDDIIILVVNNDGQTPGTNTTGFTTLDTSPTNFGPDGSTVRICWKRATGADTGSYTWGTTYSAPWEMTAYCFSGRDTGNPPVQSTQKLQTTGLTSPVSAALNGVTALAGDDLIWVVGVDTTSSSATAITGFTQPTSYTKDETAQTGFAQILDAYEENVSAGATGTVTGSFTLNTGSAGYVGWLVRIPSAGGGGATAPPTRTLMGVGV